MHFLNIKFILQACCKSCAPDYDHIFSTIKKSNCVIGHPGSSRPLVYPCPLNLLRINYQALQSLAKNMEETVQVKKKL